jgi:flagellar basal-body rod protein FlgB
MNWTETAAMGQIARYLDLVTYRQKLVVGNIANVDTPHYHTRDIDFQNELRRAGLSAEGGPAAGMPPRVQEATGLLERPDGNNVNIDRESMLLAETQLEFRIGVQLLRGEFQRLMNAIKEGSGS